MSILLSMLRGVRRYEDDLVFRGVAVVLTITFPFLAYSATPILFDKLDRLRAERDAGEARAEKERVAEELRLERLERLTNPTSPTTADMLADVQIGMKADDIEDLLQYPYDLGIEIYPFSNEYNKLSWYSHDIPIDGVGWVQAVFIGEQLVGLGSLDPNDGRVCGGCLEDMLEGERSWRAGLPYHANGRCPVCKSELVVPFGISWHGANLRDDLCCDVDKRIYGTSTAHMYFWKAL